MKIREGIFSSKRYKSAGRFLRALLYALPLSMAVSFCAPTQQHVYTPELGPSQNKAALTFLLTDFPLDNKDVTAVIVNFRNIEVHSETEGWIEVIDYGPSGRNFDLLQLQNGITSAMGSFALEPGTYTQIRLNLNDASSLEVTEDGASTIEFMKTPSAGKTGIKLVHPFTIGTNGYTVMTLDFIAQESVHYTKNNGYVLKPVIKVTGSETTLGAQATIPVKGGTAGIVGEFELDFPASTFGSDTDIEIFPLDPHTLNPPFSSLQMASGAYNITPVNAPVYEDFTITFFYDRKELNALNLDEDSLKIGYYDVNTKRWTALEGTVNTKVRKVTATASSLGAFTLLADAYGPTIEPAAVRGGGYNVETGLSLIEIPENVTAVVTPKPGTFVQSVNLHYFKSGQTSDPIVSAMDYNSSTGEYVSTFDAELFYGETEPAEIQVYIDANGSNGLTNTAPGIVDDTLYSSWHTYSYNPDADGDGMNDRWELDLGLNPQENDGAADLDGDGLSNLEEYLGGTNPNVFDATVGGVISGLSEGESIVLANNSDTLTIIAEGENDIEYRFPNRMVAGESYEVTIDTSPDSEKTCTVSDGSGTIGGAHIVNANVDCQSEQTGFITVSTGTHHKLAIQADGTLWGWGQNNFYQLGDGTQLKRTKPVRIGNDEDWEKVYASTYHSMAIKTDGTLWGWGNNSLGRAGTNGWPRSPSQVGTDNDWEMVAVGFYHTVGLKTDGTLWGWGYSNAGQVGSGTTGIHYKPVQIGTGFKSVHAGRSHSLAIKLDGSLWGWGYNSRGQLGDGTKVNKLAPTLISSDSWESAAAGLDFSVAIKSDGTLWGTGYNYYGYGFSDNNTVRTSFEQISADTWSSVNSLSGNTLLAIRSDGTLWAAGQNHYGALGTGNRMSYTTLTPVGTDRWRVASIGYYGAAGIKSDGTLWTWGYGAYGEIGDGFTSYRLNMVNIKPTIPYKPGSGILTSLSTGYKYTMAVKKDGTLWAWGNNTYGQLGIGYTYHQNSPVQVGTDTNWKKVSSGSSHVLALKKDGTLWAWGANSYGQLGLGITGEKAIPVRVGTSSNWTDIAAGGSHSLAINSEGSLYAWGRNTYGQLGAGSTTDSNVPVKIWGSNWSSISAGIYYSIGLKSDGTMYGWGYNYLGQAGSGATWKNELYPTRIGSYSTNYKRISAGNFHALALDSKGYIWSWGYNKYGQLGNGSTTYKYVPTKIVYYNGFADISAGDSHSFAIKTDGSLWGWGYNNYSQRGFGYASIMKSPYPYYGVNWNAISAGTVHSVGVSVDNEVYGWGDNLSGETGVGYFSYRVYRPTSFIFP